jgi:site-specific DNA-methyltransferase (adenine-specific)
MDIFDLCAALPRASVDMILCDLPYGTTACSWDTVIPFEPMWAAFKRIIKPRGAIVLTASQPFTSALVMSNPGMFRCEWIWCKGQGTNPYTAAMHPLKAHESVLIFSSAEVEYFPQMAKGKPYSGFSDSSKTIGAVYGKSISTHAANTGSRYPTTLLHYSRELGDHPTQKPVGLFRYLIRTYTLPGELVFDPTCGSGTTAVAAREEGRHYIVGDSSAEYVGVTNKRLAAPYTPSFMPQLEAEAS